MSKVVPECGEGQIQIAGLQCFPVSRYADAIRHYLRGVRLNLEEVMYRPKIAFPDVTLRLDASEQRYYAYGEAEEELPRVMPAAVRETGDGQPEIEAALAAFAEQASVRMLRIRFRDGGEMSVWKKADGKLGCRGQGIPRDMMAFALRDPSTPPALRRKLARAIEN